MPEISRFLGVAIRMQFREHGVPHFHAIYNDYAMVVQIMPLKVLKSGRMPERVKGFIMEWAAQHQEELLKNWERCQNGENPKKLKPLV